MQKTVHRREHRTAVKHFLQLMSAGLNNKSPKPHVLSHFTLVFEEHAEQSEFKTLNAKRKLLTINFLS